MEIKNRRKRDGSKRKIKQDNKNKDEKEDLRKS